MPLATSPHAATEEGSLVAVARSLADRIRTRVEQTEQGRCVPVATIEDFKASGLLRGLQASGSGGLERPPDEFFSAVAVISEVCPSTGWVLGVLGVHPFEVALLTPEVQDEIYGDDTNTLISSSYAPTGTAEVVPGGYRLSGRWSFSSGCDHCSWVVLGAALPNPDAGPPILRIFYLPRGNYRIDDNWHVMGLAGTGSKDIVVDDAFVPEHRSLLGSVRQDGTAPGLAVNHGALYRLPQSAIFYSALTATALGAARGALNEFVRQTRLRSNRYSGAPAGADRVLQLRLAEAAADVDGAELRMHRDWHEMMAFAEAGTPLPLDVRARHRWDTIHAAHSCAAAVRNLIEVAGGHAVFLSNPLQRFYRDAQAIDLHAAMSYAPGTRVMAHALLGLPLDEFNL